MLGHHSCNNAASAVEFYLFVCAYTAHCVAAETYHIVASPNSPCPGEFIGECCLSLQQYAASPFQDSNVTLLIESGTHRLQNVAELITRVDHFTMMAASGQDHKGTHIVFYTPRLIYYYYYSWPSIDHLLTIQIRGIHFSCTTGSICEIRMGDVQQLFIEDCSFQGVRLFLYQTMNAVIFQTCFYDDSRLEASSSNVNITRSTFSNNTQAVYFYSYSSNNALIISDSTFINNTST